MNICDTAIIGAGPYGLSLAAFLKAEGIDFRIFGTPMHTWLTQMPEGMRLKSEGFASSLYDPGSTFTLEKYCQERGIPYADMGLPVPLEVFAAYGLEFQRRFVPELEQTLVTSVERSADGFRVKLSTGETASARKVVVAAGITHFAFVPPILSALPEEFVSHSSKHHCLEQFKGREVVVVGAGASAIDLAALLHQAGVSVQVVARKPTIRFHDRGRVPRPLLESIRSPMTGIGPGWKLVFCANTPWAFHRLPERVRLNAVRRILGPAPGWFIKDEIVGKVSCNLGVEITQARVQDGRVNLELSDGAGARQVLTADHVIAATGYRVDLRRLTFLTESVRADIRHVDQTPMLSSSFESSVPGLYFVGTSAANAFGPLMRFAFGARFAAVRVSKDLGRSSVRRVPTVASDRTVEAKNRG